MARGGIQRGSLGTVPVTEPGRKMMMVKLEEEEDAATEPVLPPPPSPVDADEEDEQTDSVGDGDDAPRPTLGEPALKKGPWTPEEDDRLRDYVQAHGEGNWNQVQVNAGLNRCGKSCRLRWSNHLRPDLKKGPFDDDEVDMILRMHQNWGNKWAKMAARLPGRTDNEIKNYWNTRVKRHVRARLPLYPEYLVSQPSNQDMNFDTPEESRPNEFSQENVLHNNDLIHQYFDWRAFTKHKHLIMSEVPSPSLVDPNSLPTDAMNPLKRLKSTGCMTSDYNGSLSFVQIPDGSEKAGCSTSFNYGMTKNQLALLDDATISGHFDGNPSTSWTTQWPMKMELPSVQYSNYGPSNTWLCDCSSGSPIEQGDTLIESPGSLKSGSISSQNIGLDATVHNGDAIDNTIKSQGVFEVSPHPFPFNQVSQSSVYSMWQSFPSVPGDDEIEGRPLSEIQPSKLPSSSDAIFAERKYYPDSIFTGTLADIGPPDASLEASLLNDGSLFLKDHSISTYNSLIFGDSCEEAKLSPTGHELDPFPWDSMPGACNMWDFTNV